MRPDPRRLASLSLGVALATTLLAAPALAQDETMLPEESLPPASCDVLTADEVSAAFGETLTLVDGSGASCQFDADYAAMRFMSLFVSIAEDTSRDEMVGFLCSSMESPAPAASALPCVTEVPVGSSTGSYIPEGFGTMLYADIGNGDLLSLQLVGDPAEGVDKRTALTALGALALPRISALPRPVETAGPPEPTFLPDEELEAKFPTEIGGTELTIDSMRGTDALVGTDVPQAVLDALAAQGKTLDDVSIASAYSFDAETMDLLVITALRVRGADISAMADAFVSVFNGDEAPAEVAQARISGKDVTVVRPTADSTDDQLQYVYPSGDVLWVVAAAEPALSEVFSKLP
jgi:hypothetical protein